MYVKPEQASKVKMRMPTRRGDGEGCMDGEAIDMGTRSIRRGKGHGTRARWCRQRGRPVLDEGNGLDAAGGWRSGRESDRVIVPLKPGNAGGGKDPDFWYAWRGR